MLKPSVCFKRDDRFIPVGLNLLLTGKLNGSHGRTVQRFRLMQTYSGCSMFRVRLEKFGNLLFV